jgi:preprotein translocase subunit SecA
MLENLIKKVFWDPSEKKLKQYEKDLIQVKEFEQNFRSEVFSVEQVQEKMQTIRSKFEWLDHKNGEDLVKIRAIMHESRFEVLALHRRASELIFGKTFTLSDGKEIVWNMIPYDVQILGAMALHDGNIAEMRTGEGKSLVATIAASLGAIAGLPVHIVTVNDYLASRDAMEMEPIYQALGYTVGIIVHNQSPEIKRANYGANVVYATNNELGFDYLRDNMVGTKDRRVMGPLFHAIVDEVDSILVDEARTPLIISSPDTEPTSKYTKFAFMARELKNGIDYKIDEKQKTATLTEAGIGEIERMLGVENIYASDNYNDIHHIENALKAGVVYTKDVDYLVRGEDVLIIDEHTGRVLAGRRYSDWLHQAIEAKEGVTIQQETRTLASITFQNYFRLYSKLSGMTGTAKTEEEEFYKIYRLEVIQVPTNRPMIRQDLPDFLFKNEEGKYEFVVRLIAELYKKWQPVLVGTVSVAKSEYLSSLLLKANIPHAVLNAKQDADEAIIIAQAWKLGSVTIATNMAGRGTDIKVEEAAIKLEGTVDIVCETGTYTYPLGGLFVIGTEKHETRRIDNQLRGRSGRQGDPGVSQFFVAPTDDIMRIFGGEKLFSIFNSGMFASLPANEPLAQSGMLTSRITGVQKQVEGRNFDIRKHILEYDDVLNQHRLVMYGRRNRILEQETVHEEVKSAFARVIRTMVEKYDFESDSASALNELTEEATGLGGISIDFESLPSFDTESIVLDIEKQFIEPVNQLREKVGEEEFTRFEKQLLLGSMDELWMNHIDRMAHLREEVAFEGYAQKQPLIVYKEKAYERFTELISLIDFRLVKGLVSAKSILDIAQREVAENTLIMEHDTSVFESELMQLAESAINSPEIVSQKAQNTSENVREDGIRVIRMPIQNVQGNNISPDFSKAKRNDACPCGSGKKFKQCHGKNAS